VVRRAIACLLLAAGCSASEPSGFGVNVRVVASALANDQRARIVSGRLTVTGDAQSPFVAPLLTGIGGAIGAGELRFRYIPAVHAGKLTLSFDALDAASALVVSGVSDPVDVLDGKAVDAVIPLGGGAFDMAMVLDGAPSDGPPGDALPADGMLGDALGDMPPQPDLSKLNCIGLFNCMNMCADQTCFNNCQNMATAPAQMAFTQFYNCLTRVCVDSPTDGGGVCNMGGSPCNDCTTEAQTGTSPSGMMSGQCMNSMMQPVAQSTFPCGQCVDQTINCQKN
jgi:hypothetical protein